MTQDVRRPHRPGPVVTAPARRPRGTRRPVRRIMIVTHRWISLLLGLVLLAITTSGAILLYRPELSRWLNSDAHSPAGGPVNVSVAEAIATVRDAEPAFEPTGVVAESGILKVHASYEDAWSVDPSTGEILGHIDHSPTWVAFLENLHLCFLGCEGEPGYIAALTEEVPKTQWLGLDDTSLTWATLALLVLALMLLFLSLSGLWLWFPRPSKWKSSMSVRWRRGRFARDTDLHKVAGMIALPTLLVWGVTGAGFEAEPVETAWYAATPGQPVDLGDDPVSTESDAPDIGIDAAVASAQEALPDDEIVSVDLPAADDPTGVYYLWLAAGFDPYAETESPGDRGVVVERHTGEATTTYGDPAEPTAQTLWDSWSYPVHTGYIVNGWWRLIWLALALSPLLLAVTGVSTWLVRRSTRRSRALSRRGSDRESGVGADVEKAATAR